MLRENQRGLNEIRMIKITPNYTKYAEGSVLIELGETRVICTATVEEKVPFHIKGTGEGWLTAEYSMLPRATLVRNQRDVSKLRLSPRSAEIQRLIGRSLRASVDLTGIGARTITIDCDVIEADGGTRTASVTGGYVALVLALHYMKNKKMIDEVPLTRQVFAISGGVVKGCPMLDLQFSEDSIADVDMNLVLDETGKMIEFQSTGEESTFSIDDVSVVYEMAKNAKQEVMDAQNKAIEMGIKKFD